MVSVFTADNVRALLKEWSGGSGLDVVVHETIDSTNTWALNECKAGRSLPFVGFAEQQTAGRGRRGKAWLMSKESNIAMSLAWSFPLSHTNLQRLPLSIAMAIVEVLESFGLNGVQIKWPNDVFVDGVKIAGVLIETQVSGNDIAEDKVLAVVIGIGLNYDMSDIETSSIGSHAMRKLVVTDICSEFKKQKGATKLLLRPERLVVASKLLHCVFHACQRYQENTKFALKTFRQGYDYCENKEVDVFPDDQVVISGVAKGVTDNAELIVEIKGERQLFNSAEVSVKTGDGCR